MHRFVLTSCLLTSVACGGEVQVAVPNGSRTVTQGGAQDIGRFRQIVNAGGIPAPNTLDPVGFFAEHAVDLPEADCGRSVCLHPMLAVAPRFNGENWTMAFVAMNSPLDPSTLERPDAHVIVMVENGASPHAVEDGLSAMLQGFREGDRMTVGRYGAWGYLVRRGLTREDGEVLEGALQDPGLRLGSGASIYDALATAGDLADRLQFDGVTRVLLVSTGRADAGVRDPDRIEALAEALAARGLSIGVIGVDGAHRQDRLLARLGDIGAGTYAYAETPADLITILRQEGETALFPLAREMELRVEPALGYRIGRIYGARRARALSDRAELYSPALFLGHRTGADDVSQGRRGGGGGLFVELIADEGADREIGPGRAAFSVTGRWREPGKSSPVSTRVEVRNELAPGQNPEGMWPHFSDPARGKAFMMLNMYLALRTSVELYQTEDCRRAMGVLDMMQPSVEAWQWEYDDPDIDADWSLMLRLRTNLVNSCGTVRVEPPRDFRGSCFFI